MFNFLKKLFTKDNSVILQAMEKGAVIIDVRSPNEFRGGHIQGSKNIPVNEIRSKIDRIRKLVLACLLCAGIVVVIVFIIQNYTS